MRHCHNCISMQKNEAGSLSRTTHKSNLRWIIDLNVRHKNIKLLKENIRVNFYNCGLGQAFLDMMINAQATKEKQTNQT